MTPIGPKAPNLNRDFAYRMAARTSWPIGGVSGDLGRRAGPNARRGCRCGTTLNSGTLDARARAWLEINCAHCHNPLGPARNSGLDLAVAQSNPTAFGHHEAPVAAGPGRADWLTTSCRASPSNRSWSSAPARPTPGS